MAPKYQPAEHEPAVRDRWDASDAFHADPDRVLSGQALPYCILIPPPNVTAPLHLGHAFNNTLQDVLVRARRMMGFETLWLPGTDHAGIATQTVVDKRLKAEGKPAIAELRKEPDGREKFVATVQAFKDEYEARITHQLKMMGCSCDWQRQRFTMDPICARAVREAFFELFKDGLIYRGKRIVNWDPVTQTALADDEVEMEEVKGAFYYLRYPLVHMPTNPDDPYDVQEVTWDELAARGYPGADSMPPDEIAWVTVATTRPETYLGDTAVAVNPSDARAAALSGLYVQLPIVGRVIPIIEDDYVVLPDGESDDPKARYATGFLKVTPAHDPNDYEIGRRHNLPQINVMAPDASISDQYGWLRESLGEGGHVFLGKSREEARELVVKEFKARNLLEDVKPYVHTVGHSYRSHAAIEPYLSDQWYVRVTDDRLRGAALRAMNPQQRSSDNFASQDGHDGDGELSFHPDRYARTFESWHEHLRDWCISRQLWWGHRIPVWSKAFDEETQAAAFVDAWQSAGHTRTFARQDGSLVYVCVEEPQSDAIEMLEADGFERDPDVLDTWFSSALWPLSTLGWPEHDLRAPSRQTLCPDAPDSIKRIFVKHVKDWSAFVGKEGERSGELVELLLHLRDKHATKPLVYELFDRQDMTRPLRKPDEITSCADLVCAVGITTEEPVQTDQLGAIKLADWLLSHGFVDTMGLLEAFNPTSVLCTSREIITLWVSRMVMFNRYFLGKRTPEHTDGQVPFKDVFIHAMIQDGAGQKMSKSLGNGVDPLDIIESHGSDALRYTLVKLATQTQDVRMPVDLICPHCQKTFEPKLIKTSSGHMVAAPEQICPACNKPMVTAFGVSQGIEPTDAKPLALNSSSKFDEARNFCNKLWNASRFALGILSSPLEDGVATLGEKTPGEMLPLPDRWILSRLANTIKSCEQALAAYQFSTYATTLYDFLWRDFCDWYLEAIKPTVGGNLMQRAVLGTVLDALLRLLHPVTPFITEVIWPHLREIDLPRLEGITLDRSQAGGLLACAGWPRIDSAWESPEAEALFERVQGLVTSIREVRAQQRVAPRRKISLHGPEPIIELIVLTEPIVQTLAGLKSITHDAAKGASVPARFEGHDFSLSDLADAVDVAAERERLTRAIAEQEKKIAALEGRLAHPGYVERAPERLVNQTREQLAQANSEIQALKEQLESLK